MNLDPALKFPDYCTAPVLGAYVADEIKQFYDFQETGLKANFRTKAAIYGGDDKEIVYLLNCFRDFPGSFDFFKMTCHPYSIKPKQYKSMQQREYIYKQDMILKLSVHTPISPMCTPANMLIRDLTGFFLRAKEIRLSGLCELVPFDKMEFDLYIESLRIAIGMIPTKTSSRPKLREYTLEGLFEKLKTMLPVEPRDPRCLTVKKLVETFDSKKPIKKNANLVNEILGWLATIFSELELYIETHPEQFLPSHQIANKTFNMPIRLFIDGDNKFVFVQEVLKVIDERKLDAEDFKKTMSGSDYLKVITFADLNTNLKEHMKVIEFVPMKIRRTEHRAVYIPSFNGRYCILSVDFFMEILFHLIAIKSVFQTMDDQNFKYLMIIFESIADITKLNEPTPAFIDVKEANAMMEIFKDYIDTSFKELIKSAKKVRPVSTKGFTLKDFKAEIQYLGLKNFFKNIDEYETVIYGLILRKKEKDVLRTCDMYDALRIIQTWSLLHKMPREYAWLQGQGYCHQFPIMCFDCDNNLKCRMNHQKNARKAVAAAATAKQ